MRTKNRPDGFASCGNSVVTAWSGQTAPDPVGAVRSPPVSASAHSRLEISRRFKRSWRGHHLRQQCRQRLAGQIASDLAGASPFSTSFASAHNRLETCPEKCKSVPEGSTTRRNSAVTTWLARNRPGPSGVSPFSTSFASAHSEVGNPLLKCKSVPDGSATLRQKRRYRLAGQTALDPAEAVSFSTSFASAHSKLETP